MSSVRAIKRNILKRQLKECLKRHGGTIRSIRRDFYLIYHEKPTLNKLVDGILIPMLEAEKEMLKG